MINYFVSRKTTSFSPVDEAKVEGLKKRNNTKNSHIPLFYRFLPTLTHACQCLPITIDKV